MLAGCGAGTDADPEVARGAALVRDLGCAACHASSSASGLGPGWGVLEWGEPRPLADGTTVEVDEDYLRRSITEPGVEVAAGWDPIMPMIPVSDAELDAITAYLRDVSGG
ncbi:MAG TPA: c-type cytochrome [Acidimicrobiales bacterium]|nr:c-type cytochrome [Acidimicrobiales bacterium]